MALIALEAREIVYGAVALALSFLCMAGFYALLDAPFVAVFQVIVYVGAVAVLILFTVMLVRRERWRSERPSIGYRAAGVISALLSALALGSIFIASGLGEVWAGSEYPYGVKDLGIQLLNDYGAALIVLALVLTASIVGALTLAKREVNQE